MLKIFHIWQTLHLCMFRHPIHLHISNIRSIYITCTLYSLVWFVKNETIHDWNWMKFIHWSMHEQHVCNPPSHAKHHKLEKRLPCIKQRNISLNHLLCVFLCCQELKLYESSVVVHQNISFYKIFAQNPCAKKFFCATKVLHKNPFKLNPLVQNPFEQNPFGTKILAT